MSGTTIIAQFFISLSPDTCNCKLIFLPTGFDIINYLIPNKFLQNIVFEHFDSVPPVNNHAIFI